VVRKVEERIKCKRTGEETLSRQASHKKTLFLTSVPARAWKPELHPTVFIGQQPADKVVHAQFDGLLREGADKRRL